MTWQEIKQMGEVARRAEIANLLGDAIELNNGIASETCRYLGITKDLFYQQIKKYPQLKLLLDTAENRGKNRQPYWLKTQRMK